MADEVKNGLSADKNRIATKWNRYTVADGDWLQKYTLSPLTARDYYLASAIDALSGATGDTSSALSAAISSVSSIHDEYIDYLSATISGDVSGYINDISGRIDTLEAATDVIMVYNTYSAFSSNSSNLTLTDNDVIKVLNDEKRQENQTYYQYSIASSAWSFMGELDPYYSKTDLNTAAGKNINISTTGSGIKINTNNNVSFSSVSSNKFSGTNISALNFYIPGANTGEKFTSEISSNSTGISAHIVDTTVYDEVVTASWQSIISAANNYNAYVPLSAEACTIGTNNSAYNNSLAQGANNNAVSQSLAQGISNSAYLHSFAQGSYNSAYLNSLAQGFYNSAKNNSLAFGYSSQSYNGGFAFSPYAQEAPSLASANSFAYGIGCTADTNAFAMGVNCSAVTGGFAYGSYCSAATNSIAMGAGMVSKDGQISLGRFGALPTQYNSKVVFHVGYGQGSAVSDRRDIFGVTYDGSIISYNSGVYPQKAEVLLNGDFFEAPRKFGRKIPMLLSQGLDMASTYNVDVKTPANFSARHNVLYGPDAYFNMWIPYTSSSPTSQEFTLTKAECIGSSSGGMYDLFIGVDKNYSILFKHFNGATIKTGVNVTSSSWPNGGSENRYTYHNFFLDKDNATSNTYFSFNVPCDDIITFVVDGFSKQFIMIKGHD